MSNSDNEIEMLRREIQQLRKESESAREIANEAQVYVGKAYDLIVCEAENNAKHVGKIYGLIALINVQLDAVIKKVLPGLRADQQQIDDLFKQYRDSKDFEKPY